MPSTPPQTGGTVDCQVVEVERAVIERQEPHRLGPVDESLRLLGHLLECSPHINLSDASGHPPGSLSACSWPGSRPAWPRRRAQRVVRRRGSHTLCNFRGSNSSSSFIILGHRAVRGIKHVFLWHADDHYPNYQYCPLHLCSRRSLHHALPHRKRRINR